jgi:hypothetical protein
VSVVTVINSDLLNGQQAFLTLFQPHSEASGALFEFKSIGIYYLLVVVAFCNFLKGCELANS